MKQCFLTTNGPKAIGPYSTAVICGNTVYLSGMISTDPATGKIVEGGGGQARQVFENIKTVPRNGIDALQTPSKPLFFLLTLAIFLRSMPFMKAISAS